MKVQHEICGFCQAIKRYTDEILIYESIIFLAQGTIQTRDMKIKVHLLGKKKFYKISIVITEFQNCEMLDS